MKIENIKEVEIEIKRFQKRLKEFKESESNKLYKNEKQMRSKSNA